MKISQHIVVGIGASLPVFLLTRSLETTITFLLSNSLIDIDHFFDYWYDNGFNLNWRRFHEACKRAYFIHYVVILHSFEVLLLILFLLHFFFKGTIYYSYMLGIFLGFACHIFSDMIYNRGMKSKHFFILIRSLKKFKIDDIGDPELLCKKRKGQI